MPRTLTAPLLLLALTLAACEDPSNVGIDLVGGTQDSVSVARLPLLVRADTIADATGGTLGTTTLTQRRVLAGRASHPALGTTEARGYLDFGRPSALPEGFLERTIVGVDLVVPRTYAFGDTTAATTLELFDAAEEFVAATSSSTANADETVPVGASVTTFDVAYEDSVVTVALPEAWVAANDTLLRSVVFGSEFHGLVLRPGADASGAVYGFTASQARLRVRTAQDTVSYPAVDVHSEVLVSDAPETPDVVLLRDGTGVGLAVEVDSVRMVESGLASRALNRGTFRLPLATGFLDALRADGFAVSAPATARLFAEIRTTSGQLLRSLLGSATLNVTDPAEAYYSFQGAELTSYLQNLLLQRPDAIDRLILYFDADPAALDIAPFATTGSAPASVADAVVLVVAPSFD